MAFLYICKKYYMFSKRELPLWKVFVTRLSVMLLLLALSRWLLYWFNTGNFPNLSLAEQLRLFVVGLRFDIWTLIVVNLPFLVFYGIPFQFKFNKTYCIVVDILFVITNSIAVALNHIDVIYYRYIDKRMTTELFEFACHTDDNQGSLIKQFLVDFWFMVLIFIVFLVLIIILTRKTKVKKAVIINPKHWYATRSLVFLCLIAASVIGLRGGLQTKPMSIITAANYTNTRNMPLVLNTTYTIGRGSSGTALKKLTFYNDDIIDSLYSPVHTKFNVNRYIDGNAEGYNILLIILESHGQEMVSYYNHQRQESITPFLDSLLAQSLVFNGLANGRQSIEALTSLLSGLPSLMSRDYVESPYAANRLDGIGTVLKRHGYSTAFFHGGNNGTMNFNASSFAAGFDTYHGRNEYGNDDDFDGTWGISDMPFLQYTATHLNTMPKPFAAGVFTLSSHHPFTIPKGYTVPEGNYASEFEKTVRYTDDAMRNFFETMRQYDWYDSTIFVIVGDHVNPEHRFNSYLNGYGQFQIVTAIYSPSVIKARNTGIMMQHTDIGPSLLAAINCRDTLFSFGRNIFDSLQKPCFISCLNNIYEFSDGDYLLQSDGTNITAMFDIKADPCLNNNLYKQDDKEHWADIDNQFKLRLQQYNNRMINNKLYIK